MNNKQWKPSKQQLLDAAGKDVPDIIDKNLKVLFCGINPGLYSAAVHHHFARPGNRFWPVLFKAGFTPVIFSPFEEQNLLKLGYGITNIVNISTASADQLLKAQIQNGGKKLIDKVIKFQPRVLAILGISAYREAFNNKKALIGRQEELIGSSSIWVLPNPSGINANYQLNDLVTHFRELYNFVN